MNLQTFFDTAIAGIVAQGGPAFNKADQVCQYRVTMPDGSTRKCAIGQHIPDASYHPSMDKMHALFDIVEGIRSGELMASYARTGKTSIAIAAIPGFLGGIAQKDIRALQGVHDDAAIAYGDFWEGFRDNAAEYARQRGLDATVLSTIPRDAAAPKGWQSVDDSHD